MVKQTTQFKRVCVHIFLEYNKFCIFIDEQLLNDINYCFQKWLEATLRNGSLERLCGFV